MTEPTTVPVNQPTAAPTPKWIAGTVSGAVTTVAIWAADQLQVELPPAVAGSLVLLAAAAAGYLKKNRGIFR